MLVLAGNCVEIGKDFGACVGDRAGTGNGIGVALVMVYLMVLVIVLVTAIDFVNGVNPRTSMGEGRGEQMDPP